jgi:hypothetical protein
MQARSLGRMSPVPGGAGASPETPPDAGARVRLLAAVVTWLESAGLLAVALSAFVTSAHTTGWTSDVPRGRVAVSEVTVYVLFAAAVAWLGWRVRRGRGRVWTPYALIQVFALIAAWPMVNSDVSGYRFAGIATAVVGVTGLVVAAAWIRRDSSAVVGRSQS